jgi:hypothetical protein
VRFVLMKNMQCMFLQQKQRTFVVCESSLAGSNSNQLGRYTKAKCRVMVRRAVSDGLPLLISCVSLAKRKSSMERTAAADICRVVFLHQRTTLKRPSARQHSIPSLDFPRYPTPAQRPFAE